MLIDRQEFDMGKAEITGIARKLLGQQVTDYEVELLAADGSRVRVEISSVPLPAADGEIPKKCATIGIPHTPDSVVTTAK